MIVFINAGQGTCYNGLHSEPQLSDLINKVATKIPHKWHEVGIQLNLKHEELRFLRESLPSGAGSQLFASIFTLWKNRRTREYSWATMIEVLKTTSVDQTRLAEDLNRELTIHATS